MTEAVKNTDIQNHALKRRDFIKRASVVGVFVAIGLTFFKKNFILPTPLPNFKRSKKRSQKTYSIKEAGFYLYKQRKKTTIHYFSIHEVYYFDNAKNTKQMLAPSLKTIPPEKMDLFFSKIAPIKFEDVIKLFQSQSAKLLNIVWASGELLKNIDNNSYADYGKYTDYRNFILAVLRNDAAKPKEKLNITSRTKLIEMCIAAYRREYRVPKMTSAKAAIGIIKSNKEKIKQFGDSIYNQFVGIKQIIGIKTKI